MPATMRTMRQNARSPLVQGWSRLVVCLRGGIDTACAASEGEGNDTPREQGRYEDAENQSEIANLLKMGSSRMKHRAQHG